MARELQLYLVRHAIAAPRGEDWPDDGMRPLTPEGMTRMRRAARGLASLGVQLEVILTSPLVRARQTADILAGASSSPPAIAVVDALAPGGTPVAVVAEIAKHGKKTEIALVGHEPGIGELAAHLLGGGPGLEFKKGAVARIDVHGLGGSSTSPLTPATSRTGTLRWFLPPRVLRALRR